MLGTVTQLSNVGTIGLLLVESGFVYAIIQVCTSALPGSWSWSVC